MNFVCPTCGATSHNPYDAQHRYCGRCHEYKPDQPATTERRAFEAALAQLKAKVEREHPPHAERPQHHQAR